MGIGDELMAAGEARARALAHPGRTGRYLMTDKRGAPKWHFVWEQCEHVARPGDAADGVVQYVNGRRPYIVDETVARRTFRVYTPVPAALTLPHDVAGLARYAAGAIVFNPTVKQRAPVNKNWGLERWRRLVEGNPQYRWLQIGDGPGPRIHGAEFFETSSFWAALALAKGARAIVVHEGALHHAAAALEIPCVVIRGGFISPRVTGYVGQADLYEESEDYPDWAATGCGMRVPCGHCLAAMEAITPERVIGALDRLLA